MKRLRPGSALLGLSLFLSLCATPPASAAGPALLRCRGAIEAGFFKWAKKTTKARLRCREEQYLGLRSTAANCVTAEGANDLARELEAARLVFGRRVERVCGEVSWGLLSYPGPCDDGSSGFDASKLSHCVAEAGEAAAAQLFAIWYPEETDLDRGVELDCARTVPQRAADMLLRELRSRLHCLYDREAAAIGSSVDCLAQPAPFGFGTGSSAVDRDILRAQSSWLAGMPRSCARADFDALGFGQQCPEPAEGIVDFQTCVFEAGRDRLPALLDVAFPSDPVCGNGIPQEGEECDEGPGNSDSEPDSCRIDCVLPVCGDSTTDPGYDEECDDGNAELLDGCRPDCVREFCGDSVTNDLPNESCDDGNQIATDRCTNSCRNAVCGDGVVCSSPACTSGPGGGVELCDAGSANSASGLCKPDCSGFQRACTLTIGVTNGVEIGALTYELSYKDADGEVLGSGASVQCTSLVTDALVSFNDNETKRAVKESLIKDAGVQGPAGIARCNYATNDAGLAPGDFGFSIQAASDPDFEPVNATLGVTNIDCN